MQFWEDAATLKPSHKKDSLQKMKTQAKGNLEILWETKTDATAKRLLRIRAEVQ